MTFTLKFREETISIEGRDYLLRELGVSEYLAWVMEARARAGAKQKPSLEALIVAASLLDPATKAPAFKADEIDAWPGQVVIALSDKACALSGFGKSPEGNG